MSLTMASDWTSRWRIGPPEPSPPLGAIDPLIICTVR